MFCMQCGQKLPDGARFCMSCGTKVPDLNMNPSDTGFDPEHIPVRIVQEKKQEDKLTVESTSIEFIIHGNQITFGDSIINYVEQRKCFYADTEEYLLSTVEKTQAMYAAETDPDKKFELFADMGQKVIAYAIDKAHEFIIEQGVYTISKQQLTSYAGNSARAFYNEYQKLEEDYLRLVANEEQIREYRDMVNSSPGHWEGGGFGIKGAVKGAITAGALNMGTNMLRRIGGAISDSIDKSIINRDKNKLLNSKKWVKRFNALLFIDLGTIFNKTYEILAQNSKIAMPKFDFKQAKVFFENAKHTKDQEIRIKMYLLTIQNDPFSILAYQELLYDIDDIPTLEALGPVDYFLVPGEKKNLAGILCAKIRSDLREVSEEQQKAFLQKYIDTFSSPFDKSEFIDCFTTSFLPFLENIYEKLDEKERTAEDGTILPSHKEFALYQKEIAAFQDFAKAAGDTTLLTEQERIWMEAQTAGFQSQELNHRIASCLEVVQQRRKLVEILQRISARASYEKEQYDKCREKSAETSDIYEKINIWQEAKREIVSYPLLVRWVNEKISSLQQEQHKHEEQILENLASYVEDAKQYSTALEKLSFWRMILLDVGENAPAEVVKAIHEYVLIAQQEYRGSDSSAEETDCISSEEENCLLTLIAQRYKKLGGFWPVYTRGSESFNKRIPNAREKISRIEENERVLFLYDSSVFGNGKSGFILTSAKLHSKKFHIRWEDISAFRMIIENDSIFQVQLNAIIEGKEIEICGQMKLAETPEELIAKISATKFLMETTRRMVLTYRVNA